MSIDRIRTRATGQQRVTGRDNLDRARAQSLLVTFARLGSAITDELRARVPATTSNIDVLVMTTLDVHGPQRPADLQDLTQMTSGGITKVLDRLEAAGLIERAHGRIAGDRRAIVISITPAGERTADQMVVAVLAGMEAVREALVALQTIMED